MEEAVEVEEEAEEDPERGQMGRLRGEAARGKEVRSREFGGRLWVKTCCRSRRRRAEEERRVLGGPR